MLTFTVNEILPQTFGLIKFGESLLTATPGCYRKNSDAGGLARE
jgi:hypothetical protein